MAEEYRQKAVDYLRARPQSIALTGFMGSGKSTIGRLLAQRLNWALIDIDQHIETTYAASSSCLFLRVGETDFRAIEARVTTECLVLPGTVVSLGGAAVDHKEIRDFLCTSYVGGLIFLDGDFDVLLNRCLEEEESESSTYRPLLHQREKALARFLSRREWNSSHADLRINVSRQSCGQSVDEICEQLGL